MRFTLLYASQKLKRVLIFFQFEIIKTIISLLQKATQKNNLYVLQERIKNKSHSGWGGGWLYLLLNEVVLVV